MSVLRPGTVGTASGCRGYTRHKPTLKSLTTCNSSVMLHASSGVEARSCAHTGSGVTRGRAIDRPGSRGWHPSEMNKSDSGEQKRSSVFQQKINRGDTAALQKWQTDRGRWWLKSSHYFPENIGVTPSVAAPGDTNATAHRAGLSNRFSCDSVLLKCNVNML